MAPTVAQECPSARAVDTASAALATALEGASPKVLAEAFTELSEVSGLLASDLQRSYRAATRVAG